MSSPLEYIVARISEQNPVASKKLKKNLTKFSDEHKKNANEFFSLYSEYLNSIGKSIDYAIDCYLKMIGDMFYERLQFLETGRYANESYKDVNARIYSNPEIMDYHLHGLMLGQFLWLDQYIRFKFFCDNLRKYKPITRYLEIGAGHGLYVSEAARQFGEDVAFEVLDISPSSIEICKSLVKGKKINFILSDAFAYESSEKFDFITIGEVIEHLEDPLPLLEKIYDMLCENGNVYLTTPVNAPMIDHIYLFNNIEEIKSLVNKAGFAIVEDIAVYSDDMPEELAVKHKIPLMYACFMKKAK